MNTPDGGVIGYVTPRSIDALNVCRNDAHNGYAYIWMRPNSDADIALIPAASLDALRAERDADRLRSLQMSHERDAILDQLQAAESKNAALVRELDDHKTALGMAETEGAKFLAQHAALLAAVGAELDAMDKFCAYWKTCGLVEMKWFAKRIRTALIAEAGTGEGGT